MVNIAEIKRQMFKERLEKAFGSEEIEKARHGVYADNAENRAKQRVGQEYGQAAQPQEPGEKRQPKGGEEGGGDIKSYASNASDEALKRAAADKNAKPEVREAAKNELANRGNGGSEDLEQKKKHLINSVLNGGANKDLDIILTKNESHIAGALKKNGFSSLEEFNDWTNEMDNDSDKDNAKLAKTYKDMLRAIPAENMFSDKKSEPAKKEEKKEEKKDADSAQPKDSEKNDEFIRVPAGSYGVKGFHGSDYLNELHETKKLGKFGNGDDPVYLTPLQLTSDETIDLHTDEVDDDKLNSYLSELNKKLGTNISAKDFKSRQYGGRGLYLNSATGEISKNIPKSWTKKGIEKTVKDIKRGFVDTFNGDFGEMEKYLERGRKSPFENIRKEAEHISRFYEHLKSTGALDKLKPFNGVATYSKEIARNPEQFSFFPESMASAAFKSDNLGNDNDYVVALKDSEGTWHIGWTGDTDNDYVVTAKSQKQAERKFQTLVEQVKQMHEDYDDNDD